MSEKTETSETSQEIKMSEMSVSEASEKELRKCETPNGTWLRLGDGESWCISPLPLGSACDEILISLEELYSLQEQEIPKDETTVQTMTRTRILLNKSATFAYLLLKVNYPRLTREIFDALNLVTLPQCMLFQKICQGGEDLGDVSGEAKAVTM
ncbi:MAG: hypothetical protein U9P50_00465 [Patescibacteria group bacterium]|nr:hypothetical protein [Patescibacteria group bacterium]